MTVSTPFRAAAGLAALALLGGLGATPALSQEAAPAPRSQGDRAKGGTPEFTSGVPERARTHLVNGELARLDLGRRLLVVKVKPPDGAPFELEVQTDEGTRISSRGRVLALSEMRTGERVLVSCSDEGPRHRALLIKMGAPRKSPLLQPKAAASPAGS